MDFLGPALFGFMLVAFTVSNPISLSSSSESSEPSQSSSEEITVPRSTAQPNAISSVKLNLQQVNNPTSLPLVLQETIHNTITEQTIDMKINPIFLSPAVSVKPELETVIEPDFNATTVSPRGDSI